jgi:hypothetical protein
MEKLGSIIRHSLTTLGGLAVGVGIASPDQANEVSKIVEGLQGNRAEIIGAISIVLGYLASFLKAQRVK